MIDQQGWPAVQLAEDSRWQEGLDFSGGCRWYDPHLHFRGYSPAEAQRAEGPGRAGGGKEVSGPSPSLNPQTNP